MVDTMICAPRLFHSNRREYMKQFLLFFAISILASCGGGESTGGSGSTDGTTDAGQVETAIEGLTTPSKVSVVTAN